MNKINFLIRYIKYRLIAKTKFDIHSPFVYNLLLNVIYDKSPKSDYKSVEELRLKLLKNNTLIEVNDLGAGSTRINTKSKTIADITFNSSKSEKYAQLLYRLVKFFKPANILELGTSMGISSLYMSKANPEAEIITIEGCGEIAKIAKQNFKILNVLNIKQIIGNFDIQLPELLMKSKKIDFVFFDGNHRKEPTLNYFNQCLKYKHSNSIFIFDDIHWSEEMEEAWDEIKINQEVTLTIDLFFIGLVFFRKESTKENFLLKF